MKNARIVFPGVVLVFIVSQICLAQSPNIPKSTGLALEVAYPDKPPQYVPVPEGGSLHPSRLPGSRLPKTDIALICNLTPAGIRTELVAGTGALSERRAMQLAVYLLQANQRITVHAAANVGLVPFQITVVRVRPFAQEIPSIENRTKSIEVVRVEPLDTTFPSYKLFLRNVSSKNAVAISIGILRVNRTRLLGTGDYGRQGQPLIKSGAVLEFVTTNWWPGTETQSNGQMTAEGFVPEDLSNMSIRSVVFDDGSWEGDPGQCAERKAVSTGSKIQLARILRILHDEANFIENYGLGDLDRLRTIVTALQEEVDPNLVVEMMNRLTLPTIINVKPEDRMAELIKAGLWDPKNLLLRDIESVRRAHSNSAAIPVFRDWFVTTLQRYQDWEISSYKFLNDLRLDSLDGR